MTGPLAQPPAGGRSPLGEQIALVREALRFDCDPISEAIGEGCGNCAGCEAYAALSAIERHVQDMEQIVLSASLVGVVCPECGTDDDTYWRGGMTASWECPCEGVIFTPDHPALSASGARNRVAREKGTEGGCAACDGDPEAHGLHVCGREF